MYSLRGGPHITNGAEVAASAELTEELGQVSFVEENTFNQAAI